MRFWGRTEDCRRCQNPLQRSLSTGFLGCHEGTKRFHQWSRIRKFWSGQHRLEQGLKTDREIESEQTWSLVGNSVVPSIYIWRLMSDAMTTVTSRTRGYIFAVPFLTKVRSFFKFLSSIFFFGIRQATDRGVVTTSCCSIFVTPSLFPFPLLIAFPLSSRCSLIFDFLMSSLGRHWFLF